MAMLITIKRKLSQCIIFKHICLLYIVFCISMMALLHVYFVYLSLSTSKDEHRTWNATTTNVFNFSKPEQGGASSISKTMIGDAWSDAIASHETTYERHSSDTAYKSDLTAKKIAYYNYKFIGNTFKQCPLNCETVRNYEEADAIVFLSFYLKNVSVPERFFPKQIFVYTNYESQSRTNALCRRTPFNFLNDFYNLTMTFKGGPDTDMYFPYGTYEIRDHEIPTKDIVPTMEDVRNKTRTISWLVSNCGAPSSRMAYYEELSKHISIDVFGKCGNNTCPFGEKCLKMISREYWFDLAFENSFCEEYVSEKVFRALDMQLVPIVLGGANYTRILPEHSFIDVRDYASPKHLADYLHHLMNNVHEYMEYFTWKTRYKLQHRGYTRDRAMCRLCEILHDPDYEYKSNFDIKDYWNSTRECVSGVAEKKVVHLL